MPQVDQITVRDSSNVERDVATLSAIAKILGEVQASPTENTLLDRVKDLATLIGEVQASPTANTLLDRVKALATLLGEVQANPTANTMQDRLKTIATALAGTLAVNQATTAHDVVATITRPADTTAYTALDVVGAVVQFTNAGKAGGAAAMVTGVQLELDVATAPASAFRLHLYNATPPSALADNAAFDLPSGDRAAYLGFVDIPAPADLGATCYVEVNNIGKQVKLLSANVFGYLQTIAGYTPASGDVYKVTLHTVEV